MKPKFRHDCDGCKFLGHYAGHDVYTCGDNIIARNGNNPWENASDCLSRFRDSIRLDHIICGNMPTMTMQEYLFSEYASSHHRAFALALIAHKLS